MILFSIVIINILVFFFYQINDQEKYVNAMEIYVEQELHTIEPTLYDDYLRLPENAEQRKTLNEQVDYQTSFQDLAYTEGGLLKQQMFLVFLIQDAKFATYLSENPSLFDSTEQHDKWQRGRSKVNDWIEKLSSTKYAVIPAEKTWYTFITHQFMHGDLMHLAGNMFFLITCGFAVEAAIGHFRFLLFYLLGGIAGAAFQVYSDPQSTIPLVGASGAISAVMAMYLGVFRLKKIEFFYWFYIFVGYFRAPALLILGLYIGKEAYEYAFTEGSNVAYMAHIGGFVSGILLIFGLLLFKRDLLDDEYIEEDDSIDPYQAQQAEILNAIEKQHFSKATKLLDNAIKNAEPQSYGLHENRLLKAKLLFLTKDARANDYAMRLLSNSKVSKDELSDYEVLWKKIPDTEQMQPDQRLKAGLQFCGLPKISLAEDIFQSLMKQQFNDERMAVFAGRLAHHYDTHGDTHKADQYQDLSLQLQRQYI